MKPDTVHSPLDNLSGGDRRVHRPGVRASRRTSFDEQLRALLKLYQLEIDERYLSD